MTKIKNTKKGMAKKTLSVSLAVAMLATSNVPVWAAEFSDGTEAAFTAEVDAPVVEDNTEDVPVAQDMGDRWEVTLTNMPTEVAWGSSKTVTVKVNDVTDPEKNNIAGSISDLKCYWINVATGFQVGDEYTVSTSISTPPTTSDDVGNKYALFMYDAKGDWKYTSPSAFTVVAQNIKDVEGLTLKNLGNRTYNGSKIEKNVEVEQTIGTNPYVECHIDYTGDLVNVGTVHVTAEPIDKKAYTGVLDGYIYITPVDLATYRSNLTAKLITPSFVYTGNTIELKKSDVKIVDQKTGADVSALVEDDAAVTTTAKNVTDTTIKASVSLKANETTTNYTGEASGTNAINTTEAVKVVARDLSTVKVTVKSKPKKTSGSYTAADFTSPSDFVFEDANGNELNLFHDVDVVVPENVSNFGTYTLTIKAKADTKNVTGQTTGQFSIYSQSIEGASFTNSYATEAEEYTGLQVTKDITKLGKVKLAGNELDPADYTITFGTNVNAGTGYIYIEGRRTYEGSKAIVTFSINKATLSDVTASNFVVYNKDATKAADYATDMNLVVKAKNAATPAKEFILTEGTDYTVTYAYNTTNAPDNKVKATITLITNGNFQDATPSKLVKEVRIARTYISDSDIQLKASSYEYTGAVIVPEFDVVVNGKKLVKDTDYKIVDIDNSAKVGTATLTITGMGDYDGEIYAKANFEVTPVSAEKVEVKVTTPYTYDGTQHKPGLGDIDVTLNGNNVESQFDITSYGENINAGKEAGTLVLTPKKDNKNFTSTKTAVFDIEQKVLTGSIKVYNENGKDITSNLTSFDYDGTEKTYPNVIFNTNDKHVTENDYEIKYVNNITGGGVSGASIVVIAKGNYTAAGTVIDNSTGTAVEVKNVAAQVNFTINSKLYFTEKEVTVTDAEYAGPNVIAEPTIVVRDGDKILVKDKDYKVTVSTVVAGAQPSETLYTWTVQGIGVYKDYDSVTKKNYATGTWKIVKKNVENLNITVDLDNSDNVVVTVMNGNLKVDTANFDVKLSDDKRTATVSATAGNKYYIGSTEVAVNGDETLSPVVVSEDVVVNGNKVTVKLEGEVEGAEGYDYVISTVPNFVDGRVAISKNQYTTSTDFYYVEPGTYYAYCHPWKRVDGKKEFSSKWSNLVKFTVEATTPSRPTITSVKVSGSTVKVTYTQCEDAEGYDVVLGSTYGKAVSGENRPNDYGTLVKKVKNGTTVTATFTNVPKGTYYVGLHAWNRTSEDGKKVFSKWSNIVTRTVK